MKWDLLAIGLFCFIIYRSTKSDINVRKTGKEVNTINQKVVDDKTSSGQVKSIGLPGSEIKSSFPATSLYNISNNRKADINTNSPGNDRIAFLINNKSGPKTDFVNGGWVKRNNLYNSFHIQ